MDRFDYTGERTQQISFPLGGIGTGCVGLAGDGRLIDWEIFNRPNKGGLNGFTHFAVKAEQAGRVLDARILHGDLHPPYSGPHGPAGYKGFGWGPLRETLCGLPHFHDVAFRGQYPLAELTFKGSRFPAKAALRACNPFIPGNDVDSGLPAALFEIELANPTARAITCTVVGVLANPLRAGRRNRVRRRGGMHLLHLTTDALDPDDVAYGDMTLATDARDVSFQEYWFRGSWFDALEVYWQDLTRPGPFANRRYRPGQPSQDDHGLLAARVRVPPRQRRVVRFAITWNFPNCENYWDRKAGPCACQRGIRPTWKNYYATIWPDSVASAVYALTHWKRLWGQTRAFKDALFASDLPPAALDAVSATLSVLKSPTCLRLEDGTFYGWEGCGSTGGCCPGSCTHVWNYAQALPFLFPALERSMRDADYTCNLQDDGGMPFRLRLPLGLRHPGGRSCADGLFGNVLKVYRDWKICGDTAWLRRLWPAVKKSIAYAWHPENPDRWDPDRRGVLTGRQHHTLDMELFGPNAWLTGFYLAALKAAAEMADHLGETGQAAEYRAIFTRGKAWTDKHLFNGTYYQQAIRLDDAAIPAAYADAMHYWDAEHRQVKYQIGAGCSIDQVLAQWHANLYGLGEVFDPAQTRKALRAIYRHNFKRPMSEHYNPCRIYSLNDEGGLVICAWPDGADKPVIPVPYSQETMNGFEYAAAIQMIQNGLIREGMTVVEAVRQRYDGRRRNPWNEFECGSNYARSMAAYALLNAFSGFRFDATAGMIGFDPIDPAARAGRRTPGRFRCFWSLAAGWGEVLLRPGRVELRVLAGQLTVNVLELPFLAGRRVTGVTVGAARRAFTVETDTGTVRLARAARISAGKSLTVRTRGARPGR